MLDVRRNGKSRTFNRLAGDPSGLFRRKSVMVAEYTAEPEVYGQPVV